MNITPLSLNDRRNVSYSEEKGNVYNLYSVYETDDSKRIKTNTCSLEVESFPSLIQVANHSTHSSNCVFIRLLGTIPAGTPWGQSQEEDGCICVDMDSIGIPKNSRTFAVRVCGESMMGVGILDKDIVILEFKSPHDGAVVAALVDGEMTLKRYFMRSGKPFLRAENPRFRAIVPARELVIQGVMVALLRRS
jgi:repressor LexA